SGRFTPSTAIDMSKEKDWPMNIGMMDWDNTKIVLTKRSLMEFLKQIGVTVDPGFVTIQKLPRYAQFGTLTANPDADGTTTEVPSSAKPEAQRIFEEEFTDDALSTAPPPPTNNSAESGGFKPTRRVRTTPGGVDSMGSIFSDDTQENFVPTRKVRQRPGGADNIEGVSESQSS
ncbi:hypothetical protein BU15DRAFT_54467, partial [Melanogaster broomeanus]